MKLHKLTWREFSKHNSMAYGRTDDLDKPIPETYWFESNGAWYEVSKGSIGWNIYDESWHNVGYADTLKEIRNWTSF